MTAIEILLLDVDFGHLDTCTPTALLKHTSGDVGKPHSQPIISLREERCLVAYHHRHTNNAQNRNCKLPPHAGKAQQVQPVVQQAKLPQGGDIGQTSF